VSTKTTDFYLVSWQAKFPRGEFFTSLEAALMIRTQWLVAAALAVFVAVPAAANSVGAVYNVPPDPPPASLPAGATLNVGVGGSIGGITADAGSTININGGSAGFGLQSAGAVNLYSGSIAPTFRTLAGGVLTMDGGELGFLATNQGGVWNINGGTVIAGPILSNQGIINITGGAVGSGWVTSGNSVINLSGGSLAAPISFQSVTLNQSGGTLASLQQMTGAVWNLSGGTVLGPVTIQELNITCRTALLDGVPIPGLVPNVPTLITQRHVTISGLLADGTPYDFQLNTGFDPSHDIFPVGATLRVTVVPEPAATVLAAGLMTLVSRSRLRSRRADARPHGL
jgi:hypothetical protein